MKIDTLFYEVFRRDPGLLFELVGLERNDDYILESVVDEETNERIDGMMRPVGGRGPNVFVEIQGDWEPNIYWRGVREMATCYEYQEPKNRPFKLVFLFLDRSLDPGPSDLLPIVEENIISVYLPDCLSRLPSGAGPWLVFEPLVLDRVERLVQEAPGWREALERLYPDEEERMFWTETLENAAALRFPSLSLDEIRKMLRSTPRKEPVAGK